jgi:hypothetical protein
MPFTVSAASEVEQFYSTHNRIPTIEEQQTIYHELNRKLDSLGKALVPEVVFKHEILRQCPVSISPEDRAREYYSVRSRLPTQEELATRLDDLNRDLTCLGFPPLLPDTLRKAFLSVAPHVKTTCSSFAQLYFRIHLSIPPVLLRPYLLQKLNSNLAFVGKQPVSMKRLMTEFQSIRPNLSIDTHVHEIAATHQKLPSSKQMDKILPGNIISKTHAC